MPGGRDLGFKNAANVYCLASPDSLFHGDAPLGDHSGGTAPNSGAILSGGSSLKSFDYSTNAAPTDPDYTSGTASGGTLSYASGKAVGNYPAGQSGSTVWTSINVAAETLSEVYLEFDVSMPSASKHGFKFIKLFGSNDATGYANTTFAADYSGLDDGGILSIMFGDGAGVSNDATRIINLNGTGHVLGRAPSPVVSTPQGASFASTDWGASTHHIRAFHRYNTGTTSGNEVADGGWFFEIDGNVYVDAGALFNRNYQNSRYYDHIGIFGWTQGSVPAFTVEYDNLVISTGGFV